MATKDDFMREAIALSIENVKNGGGPFGAVIVKDGKIIAQGLPEDIITPELVKSVFDVELNISTENGKPFILPI